MWESGEGDRAEKMGVVRVVIIVMVEMVEAVDICSNLVAVLACFYCSTWFCCRTIVIVVLL